MTVQEKVSAFGGFVFLVKRPLVISSILRILRQSAKCLNSYFSSCFILQTTCPRSSVTPTSAGPGGRRPPDMWRSRSRSPAVVVATWDALEGHTRCMTPGVAPPSPTARLGHPGGWPFGKGRRRRFQDGVFISLSGSHDKLVVNEASLNLQC